MGRARGSTQLVASASRRAADDGGRMPVNWLGTKTYRQAFEGAQHVLAAGAVAQMVGQMHSRPKQASGSSTHDEALNAMWADAGQVMREVIPALEAATVVSVPPATLPDVPAHADNAARPATARTLVLPYNPVFLDFSPPARNSSWVLSNPEPLLLSAACCWDDGEVLHVAPLWAPVKGFNINAEDQASFGYAPGYRLIVGDVNAVAARLGPGTIGLTDDGDIMLAGELGPLQDKAFERTERCALRIIDALSFLAERAELRPPQNQGDGCRPARYEIPNAPAPRSTTQHLTRPGTAARAVVGRNDPCPCGSGVKYKRCCGA